MGEGNALELSYVVYNGAIWIMHSNRMNTGYEAYHMQKFEGADNLVAEMNFCEELIDVDNVEGKEKYTLNVSCNRHIPPVSYTHLNEILEIKNIAVDPENQGKGYGKALIDFLASKYADE